MMDPGNFNQLTQAISGELLTAGDAGYEAARQIWNARLVRSPAAILRCASAGDAAAGVLHANRHGLELGVRSGGHSYAGLGTRDAALLIDLSRMKGIQLDAAGKRAWVEPGVRWGEFYDATLPHGLAPTGGTVSTVGVPGFTLGGGSGWLARKHGLALDNLLAVEVVTADGKILTASTDEHPDLFWGIRGGAGNFGIVTRLKLQLHPVPEQIFAGQVIYPLEAAASALRVYAEVKAKAPEGFTCYAAAFRVPPIEAFPQSMHGQVVLDFIFGHIGDLAEGEAIARPLRLAGTPLMDLSAPQACADLFRVLDAGVPPGQRWYSRAHYLDGLGDDRISTFIRNAPGILGAFTFAYFEPLGGAVGRVNPQATAFPHRDAAYGFHILAGWTDPAEDQAAMSWTRAFHREMASGSTGVYVNLLAEDESGRIGEAYGANLPRLAELKRKWDPLNRFRVNQNIRPA